VSIKRWRVALGVAVFAALSTASMAWATLLTPTLVVGGSGSQISPAATPAATYIVYSASRPGFPNAYDAYVKPAGQPRVKVNNSGIAFAGGIDGTTFIYQHISSGHSDIGLYDVGTQTRSLPTGVNTSAWEWSPTISGDWILFSRQNPNATPVSDRVVLRNEMTSVTRVLDDAAGTPDRILTAGQVNGDYASWDRYTPSAHTGTVRLYQISTQHTDIVQLPIGKIQYASSVNAAGNLFYVRSGIGCGKQVVIREIIVGVSDTALAALPPGYDVSKTFAVDEGGGVTSLYFDRFNCATGKGADVYKLTVS
jgi:hypothetical protein